MPIITPGHGVRAGTIGVTVPKVRWAKDQLIRKTVAVGGAIAEAIRSYIGEFSYLHLIDHDPTNKAKISLHNTYSTLFVKPLSGDRVDVQFEGGFATLNNTVFFPGDGIDGPGIIYFADLSSCDPVCENFFKVTLISADNYKLEQRISGAWVELENISSSQTKVDTHAADTSTHGVAEVADVATVSTEIDTDIATHEALTAVHGVAEVADAADLTTHAAKTGDTHGLAPAATFESESGAQTKVNNGIITHMAVTNTHGAAEIADVATVSAEIDGDIATHAALTASHGVSKIADDAGIGARVYNNANISVSNIVTTTLTFNSEQYDTDTIHDTGSNTNRLTCKTAGKYMIVGHVEFATNATGLRQISIRLNGSTYIAKLSEDASAISIYAIATIYDLAVDDYVELRAYQNSGAALNVNYSAASSPYFAMQRISA